MTMKTRTVFSGNYGVGLLRWMGLVRLHTDCKLMVDLVENWLFSNVAYMLKRRDSHEFSAANDQQTDRVILKCALAMKNWYLMRSGAVVNAVLVIEWDSWLAGAIQMFASVRCIKCRRCRWCIGRLFPRFSTLYARGSYDARSHDIQSFGIYIIVAFTYIHV